MSFKTCSRCHAPNPAGANFCARCGDAFDAHAIRSVTPSVPVMQRWRKLSIALTRKDVRKLVGEPLRVEPPDSPGPSAVETWVYEYESGVNRSCVRGVIKFSAAEGRILTWNEPDWPRLSGVNEAGEPKTDGPASPPRDVEPRA